MEMTGVIKASGMMKLLVSSPFESKKRHFESKERLYQTLQDVYRNFTSMSKPIDAENEPDIASSLGILMTFCRLSLNRIIEEDGITIRESHVRLLAKIEEYFLYAVQYYNNIYHHNYYNAFFAGPFVFSKRDPVIHRIKDAYSERDLSVCYQLINYDSVLELLNQILVDIDGVFKEDEELMKTWKDMFTFLRNYLEFLMDDGIHGDDLKELLVAVENAAYEMARYCFLHSILHIDEDMQLLVCIGVLKALVLPPHGSTITPLISDKLMSGFSGCISETYRRLRKDGSINQTGTLKDQLEILCEGFAFSMHLLSKYLPTQDFEQEQLSKIRLDFQALARNVGSVFCSCFDNLEVEAVSLRFVDLTEKIDVIKGEIIKTICCVVLQKAEQESPEKDQLGSLIILLQNLKEFMDRKPGMILIWRHHVNLVLFIFYLIHNNIRGSKTIGDDELSRNTLSLDIALLSHEDLNGVLISAQVGAFNMACSSLMKHGMFHWWELYSGKRDELYLHMRVVVLEALAFLPDDTSIPHLTDEILIAYGVFVQESLIELTDYTSFSPWKEQIEFLNEGLSRLVRHLVSHRNEQKKLSQMIQCLVTNIGSFICSCFPHGLKGHMATGQRIEISDLVAKLNVLSVEAEELLHLIILEKIARESPNNDDLGSLRLLVENWKGMMECESSLIITWKDQFKMIYENLVLFKSFITSSSDGDVKSQNICSSIMSAGHLADYILSLFSAGTCHVRNTSHWISILKGKIELIEAAVMEINKEKGNLKDIVSAGKETSQVSAQALQVQTPTDVVVGFNKEMELMKDQLYSDFKRLDVISIIGMPGLGKTTLARKVYEDSVTETHFPVRAWCVVSQQYNKKELLLTILSHIKTTNTTERKNEKELSAMVHHELKQRRYLIVLDDVWSMDAFRDLRNFFPDDSQGSRILLTSRIKVTGSEDKSHRDPIELGLLQDKESWDLLEHKVYPEGKFPPQLRQIGEDVAKKCRGLPLTVVLVAGILANLPKKQEIWEQVAGNLSAFRDSQSHIKDAVELSYKYLPDCAKPMFLYLGAFPEDANIPVKKIIRLWVAEGFVQKTELLGLESQAEKILMDLIDRSLVMVAKRRWDGGVKTCHVHDLLRDMCLFKAKEENFMHHVHVQSKLQYPMMYQRRLSVFLERNIETTSRHLAVYKDLPMFSITPPIYSLLFFRVGLEHWWHEYKTQNLVPVISSLKLLRVFDAEIFQGTHDDLYHGITMLVHLRYVFFNGKVTHIPPSISRLHNLEILIIRSSEVSKSNGCIYVPETIWELRKLRHIDVDNAVFSVSPENSLILENLQTLSTPHVWAGREEMLFQKVPSLKKLKWEFIVQDGYQSETHPFPNMDSLGELELFKVHFFAKVIGEFKLPSTLKKLSITNLYLRWSQISIFQALPNLEVLKLKYTTVEDEVWDMGESDVFKTLKCLKIQGMRIRKWNASPDNFPTLEKLVLEECGGLEVIPSDLGDFYHLQKIEVIRCNIGAVRMAEKVKKEQEEIKNDSLTVEC